MPAWLARDSAARSFKDSSRQSVYQSPLKNNKKDGSLPYVSEPGAVTLEDGKFLDARLHRVWSVGPRASVILCVIGRVGERTEGYADVEVGEDELNTGFWGVRICLVGLR